MLLKTARWIGLSICGLALANVARAEETNVTTVAKSMRIGGEFRSELIYTNNGLAKTSGYTPQSSSDIQVTNAALKLECQLGSKGHQGGESLL